MNILTPIFRRPSTWTFVSAVVAFLAIYGVEDRVDPSLLLDVVQALLALLGLGSLVMTGYASYITYRLYKAPLTSADVSEILNKKDE